MNINRVSYLEATDNKDNYFGDFVNCVSERKRDGVGMDAAAREVNDSEQGSKRQKLDGSTARYVSSCSINIGFSNTSNNSNPNRISTFEESCEEFNEAYVDAILPHKNPEIKRTSYCGGPCKISYRSTVEPVQLEHYPITRYCSSDKFTLQRPKDSPGTTVSDVLRPNTGIALPRTSSSTTTTIVTVPRTSTELEDQEDIVETLRNRISRMSLCRAEDVVTRGAQYYIVGYNTRAEISKYILGKTWCLGNKKCVGRQWNLEAGPVFLFFTVINPNGHYSAVAKFLSKIGSQYEVEWLRVIDMPKGRLSGDYLESSTVIVQEMDVVYGKSVLETMLEYEAETEDGSVFDDIKDTTQIKKDVGLRNLGNTCYMNCVLQCLAKFPWKSDSSTKYTRNDLTREFFRVMNQLSDGFVNDASYSAIDPQMLRDEVAKFSNRFATYQQQDAHELLLCLLGELNKALKSFQLEKPIEVNPIQDLLNGKFRNSIRFECKHDIFNDQPFYSVTMAIPEDYCRRGSVTINEIIESFTREDMMEAMCLSCGGELKKCSIQTEFLRFPPVLILHIQRFRITDSRKLDTVLRYPLTGLRFRDSSGKVFDYDLIGACHHFGSMHGGHYIAEVKNRRSNKWLSCSDSSVNEINLESRKDCRGLLSSDSVCILFYELSA